jgi:hypothetical protein
MQNKYIHHKHENQPSVMHDSRHPMRQTLTPVEDLIVDINSEVQLSELSAGLTQTVHLMATCKSSDPAFWLHAFKFLNEFKDDIYTRLWTGNDEADHQARLVLARHSAAIQIRLLIRDKHISPALQSALNHMFGPALAILMLRSSHDRQSRTLIDAMQLVYDAIENYQESPISLDPYNRPAEKTIAQRVQDFFKGITGIKRALTPQALTLLQSDDNFSWTAHEYCNSENTSPTFTAQVDENAMHDESRALPSPTLLSPVVSASGQDDSQLNATEAQNNSEAKAHDEDGSNELMTAPSPVEPAEPTHASATDSTPILEPPPPPLDDENDSNEDGTKADVGVVNNLALNALLEKIMHEHRLTWFQVQACEDCHPRRLMFGSYERERQLVVFVNVRQEPSLTLSVADFDAGLKAGLTHPIYDEPALKQLLLDYLASQEKKGANQVF